MNEGRRTGTDSGDRDISIIMLLCVHSAICPVERCLCIPGSGLSVITCVRGDHILGAIRVPREENKTRASVSNACEES